MAGAPAGNQNAAKAKQWSAAIERALERLGDPSLNPDEPIARSPKMKALDAVADKFVACLNVDLGFFKEFGDRLEGKPMQSTEISGDPDRPLVTRVERTIIDNAKPTDA